MNSKKLTLISMVLLLVFGLFLGGKGEKVATPIKPVNKIQKIDTVAPVADITPIDPVEKIANIAKIEPVKIIKKNIDNISDKQNPFFDPDDESIEYPAVVKLPDEIKHSQNPFSDPDEKQLSDYEIQYQRLADLQRRAEKYANSMVEYSLEQIPQEVKEQTTDIIGFFHETATDVINTIPTSETNDSEEDFYSGY